MDLAQSSIAVTGATGFIGRYLVRELLGRGARVIGVVRNPDKVPALAAAGVELRRADLCDTNALARAFAGVDAVIANAGVVSIGTASKAALIQANVEGTRNVFEAMRRAKVRRAVFNSSASAYRRKRGVYREEDPLMSENDFATRFSYYAVTKAVAEQQAWRLADRFGIDLTVARPGGVYGAWDRAGFTPWFLRVLRPRFISAFPVELHVPTVYGGDLAQAMCTMLERAAARGRAYNITGDPSLSFWDLLLAFRAAGGRTPRFIVPVPVPLRFCYDLTRARDELGFCNRPAVDGFAETLELEGLSEPAPAARPGSSG
jgi:dihydroflavonol-4-reductase